MPPTARTILLACLWACPVWAAAQTLPSDGYPRPRHQSPSIEAFRAPSATSAPAVSPGPASQPGSVVPALFNEPATFSTTASEPERPTDNRPASRGQGFHLPLPPPGSLESASSNEPRKPPGGLASMATVVGSLAVVLGLFFVLVWAMRRAAPRGSTMLPTEVVEILGRAPLAARQQVHLLRCGAKLLLVCVTPTGAETLTEITDPDEVTRLSGLCRQDHPDSATATFRDVFGQLSREGSVLGFLGGRSEKDNAMPEGRNA